MLSGSFNRFWVPGIDVAGNSHARIGGQHALQASCGSRGAIGNDDHAGMLAVTDAYPAAVME